MKIYRLINQEVKRLALAFISNLPTDKDHPLVIKIDEDVRTLEQNSLMWPLLDCFSEQKPWVVNGEKIYITSEDWKDLLTAAFRNETQRIAMGLNGGMVILGARTSKMSKRKMSEFIDYIYQQGAELGVNFEHSAK